MRAYWASGEPQGKAGAYAIQGLGAVFVVEHLRQLHRRHGAAAVRDRGDVARARGFRSGTRLAGGRRVTTEILINVAPRENRAALIENGVLTELFIERQSRRGIVSNLYKGRVQRVLPGMQAAFIDVGLERTAFLHAADIAAPIPESTLVGEPTSRTSAGWSTRATTSWCRWSRIRWAPRARASPPSWRCRRVSWSTCRAVRASASRRASRTKPSARGSRQLVTESMPQRRSPRVGYIVRTAAQGATAEAIREDIQYLCRLWQHVQGKGSARIGRRSGLRGPAAAHAHPAR